MAELHPASGFVLIAGPDGAGKSTVLEAIVARATEMNLRVSRAHYRPGVIAGQPSDGVPVTDPHGKPPRSEAASVAKLMVIFADHLIGGFFRWRSQRRAGLLLLERGWYDMVVDPRRYRMSPRFAGPLRLLGKVLPRPDLVLLLTGDPATLHARKPEIGVAEVDRQVRRWRQVAPVAGRRVMEVDTVQTSPEDAADAVFASLRWPAQQRWRAVPLTPRRLALCTTGDALPALAVYQPQSMPARAASLVQRTVRLRGRRVAAPLAGIEDLWRLIGIEPSGVAAMRSSTPGRLVLSACADGQMCTVVKIGAYNDKALRNEATMLAAPLHPELPVGRPTLMWTGEWEGRFVVATGAAQRSSSSPWTADEVVPLVQSLAAAGANGAPITHGDLAPWNLVRTVDGPVLLDWESARWADEPLHDLAHFVVQDGALLGRYGPDRAIALLCDVDSPGWRLLEARGLDGGVAMPMLGCYLDQASPTEPRAVRYRAEMLRQVG